MKARLAATLAAASLAALLLASPAGAAFGVNTFDVTYTKADASPATQAGSHPFEMTTTIEFNTKTDPKLGVVADGSPKDLVVDLPPGLVGDRDAVPPCSNADFLLVDVEHANSACPNKSAVGVLLVRTPGQSSGGDVTSAFNLTAPPGVAAKIGFVLLHVPVTLLIRVNPQAPHNLIATLRNTSDIEPIGGSELTIWGNPSDSAHDAERGECVGASSIPSCPVDIPDRPFLTLPRACTGPLYTSFQATSWEEPAAAPVSGKSTSPLATDGCEGLEFAPTIKARPSASAADSPSGLDFDLEIDDPGLTDSLGKADSDIKKAVVTLPEGLTTNSSVANGLGACTLAQYKSETVNSDPGSGCPESAKVGNVEVETPLLEREEGDPPARSKEILRGSIYVAKQGDNPFDNLLTIYVVIKDPGLGILVRTAGRVEPNPVTGQLTTTFDDLPQLPFSHFHFHFREGQRAPLITPATCATYTISAALYPYSNPQVPLSRSASFEVNSGANGAPCATSPSQLPNKPSFSAGTVNPLAGAYSPFVFKLERQDGSQQLRSVNTTLPKGLIGKLAGIPYCSEAQIAIAQARGGEGQGALELASPSCPAASELGSVQVGAGAGTQPYYVSGRAYLAGPYKGAPLSLEIITPALAGPFDLGSVAVRTALEVDPETTEITAVSDPLPTILHGLPLDVRSIALNMNRPQFTLNPTSCEPAMITGSAISTLGSVAPLSSYFQASSCERLGFKPKLSLKLKGGTKRNKNPALTATLTYPKGSYANIARAQVTLPHSEFLDQSHIKTICTRVQFAAQQCPKAAIYGKAKALTPLLDKPVEGPVYLRSSANPLPDLVADLRGQIQVVLVGRIDSVNGGIRTTFESVPDAPVSKFTLQMQGGKKGLLVNSANLCRSDNRASVRFKAQNGKLVDLRPELQNECSKKKAKKAKGPSAGR
jgi:hypothetical protein